MRVPLRSALFARLHDHLTAALPGIPVERNPSAEVAEGGPLPCVCVYDGDQVADTSMAAGETLYTFTWDTEGHVRADPHQSASDLRDHLHAQVIEAVVTVDVPIVLQTVDGPIEIWTDEVGMSGHLDSVADSDVAGGGFQQSFTFQVRVPRGLAFVNLP